jgi:hypothetical protein
MNYKPSDIDYIYDNCFDSIKDIAINLNRGEMSLRKFMVLHNISIIEIRNKKLKELGVEIKRGHARLPVKAFLKLHKQAQLNAK